MTDIRRTIIEFSILHLFVLHINRSIQRDLHFFDSTYIIKYSFVMKIAENCPHIPSPLSVESSGIRAALK